MNYQDLFLTPLYLLFVYGVAYALRSQLTNQYTKPYFIPALTVKLLGAIVLGILYNTIYGGDTNNYFNQAGVIYHAFGDSFSAGYRLLLLSTRAADPTLAQYTDQMSWVGRDNTEFLVIQVASILALIGFNTYSVTAVFFAVISFTGMWAMYMTFVKLRPQIYKNLAIATLFLPSVFFWGSGLLKDSLCIGALGWIFYSFHRGIIEKKNILRCVAISGIAAYVLIHTKIYILLAFMPPALLWAFNENSARLKSASLRLVARPVLLLTGCALAFYGITTLTKGDKRFDLEKVGKQSKITADYLLQVSRSQNGSGYSLGEQDGTIGGMLKLAPQAVVVSLFRPFLWEARNVTMLLSALEGAYFLLLTIRIFWEVGFFRTLKLVAQSPALTLCFVFSIMFAISVGVSSSNFGTLVRYKIPLMPFYLSGLYIMQSMISGTSLARAKPARHRLQPA